MSADYECYRRVVCSYAGVGEYELDRRDLEIIEECYSRIRTCDEAAREIAQRRRIEEE